MRPEQAHALAARPAAASSKALIPSLLIFTYKCDLLADQSCVGSDRYSSQNEAVMRDNMWNTIRLHGGEVCTVKGDCPASTCMSCTLLDLHGTLLDLHELRCGASRSAT